MSRINDRWCPDLGQEYWQIGVDGYGFIAKKYKREMIARDEYYWRCRAVVDHFFPTRKEANEWISKQGRAVLESLQPPWIPTEGGFYWFVDSEGNVQQTIYRDFDADINRRSIGNCFETSSECGKVASALREVLRLFNTEKLEALGNV